MMAKPIRALELHYPMIQFLIIERKSVTSCYRGSKISGRQQLGVFAMVTANSKETIGLHWHLHCCFVHSLAIVARLRQTS